jgi:very-short-patch-repair endonuclease
VGGVCFLRVIIFAKMKPRRKIIPYNPILKERARFLRNNSTNSEIVLWQYLKNKQLLGYDFDRQRPVDNYILDFFCNDLMLGIEIDGITHEDDNVKIKDARKEARLNELGITVLRFDDVDVRLNPQYYFNVIMEWIIKNTTP